MRVRASSRSTPRRRAASRACLPFSPPPTCRRQGSAAPPMRGRGGASVIEPLRPALAADRVLHVGQPVALVVASSASAAQDAAEGIVVDYEALEPVI
ncbi:MAG: hypothetical protein ACXW3X_12720, partial [Rhodoplanes sp.]